MGDYEARRKDDSTVLVHSSVSPVRDDTGEIVATVSVSNDVSERRSLEEMVRQDSERLRIAFATARMGAWSWDATTNVVTWDEHMEARYGLSPGTFGGTFEEYVARVHPDDRDGVVKGVAAVQEAASDLMSEHRVVWPDGTVHWLEARGQTLYDDDGVFLGMVGVGIDIDERKQLEALMLETSQLRTTAGLVSDLQEAERIARLGSWRWQAASNTVTLSAEMARMLACERTMSGTDFQDALQRAAHPDDAPELTRSANEALRSRRQRYVMECRLVVDGDVRQMVHRGEILLDDADGIVAVRGTFQDVTEQRAAETALLAARERLARERRAVQVLQETLIRPGFPTLDAFDIAARYLPAEDDTGEIGGDWYDAFLLPDGRVMLAVGDVSGHGLSSARLMAKLRHATRAYTCIGEDLGDLLCPARRLPEPVPRRHPDRHAAPGPARTRHRESRVRLRRSPAAAPARPAREHVPRRPPRAAARCAERSGVVHVDPGRARAWPCAALLHRRSRRAPPRSTRPEPRPAARRAARHRERRDRRRTLRSRDPCVARRHET